MESEIRYDEAGEGGAVDGRRGQRLALEEGEGGEGAGGGGDDTCQAKSCALHW